MMNLELSLSLNIFFVIKYVEGIFLPTKGATLKHYFFSLLIAISSLMHAGEATLTIDLPVDGSVVTDPRPAIKGKISQNGSPLADIQVDVLLNGTQLTSALSDNDGVFSLGEASYSRQLSPGQNTITAKPGSFFTGSTTIQVALQTETVPAPVISTPANGSTISQTTSVTIGGTYTVPAGIEPGGIEIFIKDNAGNVVIHNFAGRQNIRGMTFDWVTTNPLNSLLPGQYAITAIFFGKTANGVRITSQLSAPISINVNLVVHIELSPSIGGFVVIGSGTAGTPVTGTSNPTCFVPTGLLKFLDIEPCVRSKTPLMRAVSCQGVVAETTVNDQGQWTLTIPLAECPAGANQIDVQYTDPSGNPQVATFIVFVPGPNAQISTVSKALINKYCGIIVL